MTPIHPRFDPSPEMSAQILERFAAREGSLADIASDCQTTLYGLVEWTNRPNVRGVLDSLEAALMVRHRFIEARRWDRQARLQGEFERDQERRYRSVIETLRRRAEGKAPPG